MLRLPCMHHLTSTAVYRGSFPSTHTARAEHITQPKAHSNTQTEQRDTPSSGWTVSHHKTVALAAVDLEQEKNVWQRTEGGREGAEERESMQRSSVTQQYTQIFFPCVSEFLLCTVQHKCCKSSIQLQRLSCDKVSEGHWTYTVYTVLRILRGDTLPFPPSYHSLLPGRVVTATCLQLYDPTLCNMYSIVHTA